VSGRGGLRRWSFSQPWAAVICGVCAPSLPLSERPLGGRLSDGRKRAVRTEYQAMMVRERGPVAQLASWEAAPFLLLLRLDHGDLAGRDFAQRGHDFLVVRIDQRPSAFEELFGPACRAQNQFKTIGNPLQAILYGNSCHCSVILRPRGAVVNEAPSRDAVEFDLSYPLGVSLDSRPSDGGKGREMKTPPNHTYRRARSNAVDVFRGITDARF